MARGRATTILQDQEIIRLASEGHGPAQIYQHLGMEGLLSDPHPLISESTVVRRVKQLKTTDESGPWSAIDAYPEEARLILEVAAEVYRQTEGRVWLTNEVARLVAQVRALAPSAPILWAHGLARAYLISKARKLETRGLDLTLAMEPWKDRERAIAWSQTLRETLVSDADWPGGATGILTLIALLPIPEWADENSQWAGFFWSRAVGVMDYRKLSTQYDDDDSSLVDSNLTAEPEDTPIQPGT